MNKAMSAFALLMVVTFLGTKVVHAQENYIFAGLSRSGGVVFVVNGSKIDETKLLDELVSLFKKMKAQEKTSEFWIVISTDLKISDYFALKGLLEKASPFNEKSYFYSPSTKKMVAINIEGPAKYIEWLDRDLKKNKLDSLGGGQSRARK